MKCHVLIACVSQTVMDVYYTSDVDETPKDDLYYESLSRERNRATVRLENSEC